MQVHFNGYTHEGIFHNRMLVSGKKKNGLRKLEGIFKDGELDGMGKITYKNGTKIIGHFLMGKLNGEGEFIYIYIYIYRNVFQYDRPFIRYIRRGISQWIPS